MSTASLNNSAKPSGKSALSDRLSKLADRIVQGLTWLNTHRRTAVIGGVLGLIGLWGLLWGMFFWGWKHRVVVLPTMAEALAHLDAGEHSLAWAQAETLRQQPDRTETDTAGVLYIRGVVRSKDEDD